MMLVSFRCVRCQRAEVLAPTRQMILKDRLMIKHQSPADLPLLPLSRREFLRRSGLGCGSLALTWLLHREGMRAQAAARPSHFGGKTRAVIWLFMTGGPSQVDTFDYKPELKKRDGQ